MGPKRKRKKTEPVLIKSKQFTCDSSLGPADLERLRAPTPEEAYRLLAPNGSDSLQAFIALELKPDNSAPQNANIYLKGSFFSEGSRVVNCKKFLNIPTPLQLVIEEIPCSKFTFENSLVSKYVDGGSLSCYFRRDKNADRLSQPEALAAGFRGFSLRCFLLPLSENRIKVAIVIYPRSFFIISNENALHKSEHFPGVLLFSYSIPLIPRTRDLFEEGYFGLPVLPALISPTPFTADAPYPNPISLISFVAEVLRSVVYPVTAASAENLLEVWSTIREEGVSALQSVQPELMWPPASNPPESSDGKFSFCHVFSASLFC